MAQNPRVVAELGRPETPDETASRKAESSRIYRSSQNTRNLVAALLVTLAVVAVIIFAVPRGAPPAADPIDVAAVAESISSAVSGPAMTRSRKRTISSRSRVIRRVAMAPNVGNVRAHARGT